MRIPAERGQALLQALQALGEVDEQFIAALEAEQAQSPPMQERPLAPTIYDRVVE